MKDDELERLDRKALRMARARRRSGGAWQHVAHAGTLGLILVVPPVIGAAIGRAITRAGDGRHAAIIGLVIGLVIGAVLAFLQVRLSLKRDPDDPPPPRKEAPP